MESNKAFAALAFVLCIFAPAGARAQLGADCPDSRGTRELADCLSTEITNAEGQLAAKYAAVQTALEKTPSLEEQLSELQETWKLYVKQTCDDLIWSFWEGGTIQAPATGSCKLELTRERINAFDQMFGVQLAKRPSPPLNSRSQR